jgi:hypothetical protein
MKKLQINAIAFLLIALLTVQLAACGAKPSAASIQAAVEQTLAAAPTQPPQPGQVVTKLVEVTRVVEVTAPPASSEASSTPADTDTPAAVETATETPTATQEGILQDTATPEPAAVQPGEPLNWSLQYFVARYNFMTDLQRKEFAASLPGKTVSWYASLNNVNADGSVVMKFPYGMQGSLILNDIPTATATRINHGDQVEFTGMITSFDIVFNILVLNNVKVTAFYVEPTPTITPTPTPVTPTPGISQ